MTDTEIPHLTLEQLCREFLLMSLNAEEKEEKPKEMYTFGETIGLFEELLFDTPEDRAAWPSMDFDWYPWCCMLREFEERLQPLLKGRGAKCDVYDKFSAFFTDGSHAIIPRTILAEGVQHLRGIERIIKQEVIKAEKSEVINDNKKTKRNTKATGLADKGS